MQFKKYIIIGLLSVGFSSCGEYHKVLKSDDSARKYAMAEELYKTGKYRRATELFKQIANEYAGRPQGERIFYMYGDAYYKLKQYTLAAYPFQRFQNLYPRSEKVAEVAFLEAKMFYIDTPEYSVDQQPTNEALEKLQLFLDKYPNSEYAKEASDMVVDLLTRLQKKEFEIAKQYNTIRDYQASMTSLDNFLANNPGSVFREEALYVRLNSAYEWAINSVEHKKKERLNTAKEACEILLRSFPETKYRKEADKMLEKIESMLKNFS